jgi:hypothetical protein
MKHLKPVNKIEAMEHLSLHRFIASLLHCFKASGAQLRFIYSI